MLTDVLLGGHYDGGCQEDDESSLVVKPEDVVVDTYLVKLDERLDFIQ